MQLPQGRILVEHMADSNNPVSGRIVRMIFPTQKAPIVISPAH